ncbi:hypothetical protein Q5Y75_16480 [Ruegeria sp. 2205SS24-7]|uniref:hypothetical protein n=1 Tax=Ruegeria discodermiae TaxID=3064389 RepID=UPI002741F75A|nr:hypothetical protein [Ruegeria sp. 2205SS24-7]MDP5218827.1 hypothetical protein [Ruegeria sp. 2205SS24-7]
MICRQLASILFAAGLTIGPQETRAYDMDCAIMLCMAGNFPSSAVCSAAYAEMIRRITPWPSRPPFGVCTYAAAPVALGGQGGEEALDISSSDYDWLRRTRVLWWRGRTYERREEPRQWDWSVRSCDHEIQGCQYIVRVYGSHKPWPASFTSANNQNLPTPKYGGFRSFYGSAVMMEYSDYQGTLDYTDWVQY